MAFTVLILGGTEEARRLALRLIADTRYSILLSFAGRTEGLQARVDPCIPHRIGGFGGADGLARFLRAGMFDAVIDATHPYAARISANAVHAAEAARVPLLRLTRPAWTRSDGDDWREVASMEQAALALGDEPRRVFLTIGRQEVDAFTRAPQHVYLVRAIDPFETTLPDVRVLLARGPFTREAERALLQRERIERLVSKNAGSALTYAKIEAARELAIPVIMVARPLVPEADETASLDGVVRWLEQRHGASRSLRGE